MAAAVSASVSPEINNNGYCVTSLQSSTLPSAVYNSNEHFQYKLDKNDSVYYLDCAIRSRPSNTPLENVLCYKYEYFRMKEICKTMPYFILNIINYLWECDITENNKSRRHDILEYDIKRVRNFLNIIAFHCNGMFDEVFPDNPMIFREAAMLDFISMNKNSFISYNY